MNIRVPIPGYGTNRAMFLCRENIIAYIRKANPTKL